MPLMMLSRPHCFAGLDEATSLQNKLRKLHLVVYIGGGGVCDLCLNHAHNC